MSSQHIKTIFFGGSFDPPHVAHMQMLDQAAAAISADKFVIVPAVKAASVTGKKGPSADLKIEYPCWIMLWKTIFLRI